MRSKLEVWSEKELRTSLCRCHKYEFCSHCNGYPLKNYVVGFEVTFKEIITATVSQGVDNQSQLIVFKSPKLKIASHLMKM